MPKLATMIGHYRDRYEPEQLLLVDCGDHIDRVRIETEGTTGAANIAVMNATGYEAFVPGNNEGLTFPKSDIAFVLQNYAQFAILGTNMLDRQTGSQPPWMNEHLIVEKKGLRIGILGVTACYNEFYEPLGWQVTDPMMAVAKQVDQLRGETDFILVMSHVGLQFDRQLAQSVSGIDYIIGGHTHHLLEQAERVGDTWIGAAGKLGMHLGVIELAWNAEHKRVRIVQGGALPVTDQADDPYIRSIIEQQLQLGIASMDQLVAELSAPVHHDPRAESELGNLLAAGIRNWTNTELAIVNSGQLLSGLSAGRQTDADLLAICPSPINPCSMSLSGAAILQALEESLLTEFIERSIRGYGFRGKQLGVLCLSGIEVDYDPTAPANAKIKRVLVGGSPLQLEKVYRVGSIDMFTFGIGYLSLANGQDIHYFLPEFIRDVLKHELRNPASLARSKQRHWRLIEGRMNRT